MVLTLIYGVECLPPSGCDRNMEPRSSNPRGLIYRSVEEIMLGSFGLQGKGSHNNNKRSNRRKNNSRKRDNRGQLFFFDGGHVDNTISIAYTVWLVFVLEKSRSTLNPKPQAFNLEPWLEGIRPRAGFHGITGV